MYWRGAFGGLFHLKMFGSYCAVNMQRSLLRGCSSWCYLCLVGWHIRSRQAKVVFVSWKLRSLLICS